jgi:SPP1 gp7 family putative phage head morphogenesis protein
MRIASEIYAGQEIAYDSALLQAQAAQLTKAIFEGYGKDFMQVEFGTPDGDMLANLANSVHYFSAAKNYHQLKDMTLALMDGERVRSFSEFKQAVGEINDKYNQNWLKTEYNTAISSSQMASRWAQFEKEKDEFSMLQYQTVGDSNVRESHAAIDGVKKKVSDSFWLIYYPPNGWGCRCDVIQLNGMQHETPNGQITPPAVPAMFKTNLAKTGVVFPLSHPYYIDIPNELLNTEVKRDLSKYYDKVMRAWLEENVDKHAQTVKLDNFKSGKVTVSRSAMRELLNHASQSRKLIVKEVQNLLPQMKFEKNVPLAGNDEKLLKKAAKGVVSMNYYSFKVNDIEYLLNMEVYTSGEERMYAITTNKKSN